MGNKHIYKVGNSHKKLTQYCENLSVPIKKTKHDFKHLYINVPWPVLRSIQQILQQSFS